MGEPYEYQDYMVVSEESVVKLVKTIKKFLASGWICSGGVAVERRLDDHPNYPILRFYQALVRKLR